MTPLWIWVAGLLAVVVAFRLIRPTLAFVLAPGIAQNALAAQPDNIHLDPAADSVWRDEARLERLVAELATLGFADAGGYLVREMPGVRLRLLANAAESTLAAVYEHDQAGGWFDFACRFTDGTSATWTTSRPSGLDPRPGHPVHHLVGAPPETLWRAVRRERPAKPARPSTVSNVVFEFESAWAESIAWRKQQGLTRLEVVRAGTRKAA